ncbi:MULTISPECIES: hypothetical protein [unclassified Rathayibacter]|uniref:hypothetical protein n=1 Tax=unclassified Rathayibacter TaxID=2609250 RepID=UPI00188A60E5|nr:MULTISPECIES: hypothetical protein [unclassified Rathayibacter]MBF4463304.1 hypothetical protein [Rathayibacter sp. VKM Ac-2879]MBF4504459.1 hypothetical protein [Rathayibacter sp. VKM Ac-2878]
MSQIPPGPTPAQPPVEATSSVTPSQRPLGAGGWTALAVSVVVGVLYTGVLGTLLAFGVGSAIDAASESAPTSAPGVSDEPFGDSTDDPFSSGDPSDPLYDYPGYQDGDAAVVLAQPSAEKARSEAEAGIKAVETAVLRDWTSADDEYYEKTQNAYGGPSLLYNYISATDYAEADLSTDSAKQEVVDRFTRALAPLGFDKVDVARTPSEWSSVGYEYEGDLSDDEASTALWIVTAYSDASSVPAVEIGLVDLDADPSGDVASMLDKVSVTPPDQGAFLAGYANSVLEEGDRAEFTQRMQEFGGIPTT